MPPAQASVASPVSCSWTTTCSSISVRAPCVAKHRTAGTLYIEPAISGKVRISITALVCFIFCSKENYKKREYGYTYAHVKFKYYKHASNICYLTCSCDFCTFTNAYVFFLREDKCLCLCFKFFINICTLCPFSTLHECAFVLY